MPPKVIKSVQATDEVAAFKLIREKIRNKVTLPALTALLNMAVDLIEKLP